MLRAFWRTKVLALMAIVVTSVTPLCAAADPVYPIETSGNGRYLVDQTGAPFLVNGDTAWILVNALSKSDVTDYFANCQANGINAVMWEMIQSADYGGGGNPPNNAESNAPFTTSGDFLTPNEVYWAHVDWIVEEAAKYDIALFSFPAYMEQGSNGWQDEIAAQGATAMANYGTWIGNRYKDSPNIVWVGGGDFNDDGFGSLEANHNAMMNAIKAADPNHIATSHSPRNTSALDHYNEPWLDLNSTYSNLDTTLSRSEVDWNRIATAPTFYLEGDYQGSFGGGAGDDIDDQQARFQAYAHILGGGSGHFYGHHEIWNFASNWVAELSQPGRTSLQYLANLFASRPYQDIVPDYAHTLVTAGYGDWSNSFAVPVGLGNGGNTLLAYFPSNSYTITVDMSQIGGASSDSYWFNVRDGSATLEDTYDNSGSRQFTPPGSGDWLLVVDNAALNLDPPGTGNAPPPPTATIPKAPVLFE